MADQLILWLQALLSTPRGVFVIFWRYARRCEGSSCKSKIYCWHLTKKRINLNFYLLEGVFAIGAIVVITAVAFRQAVNDGPPWHR